MASHWRIEDVGAALSHPRKRHHAGRRRGGRWPVGGGLISRLSRAEYHARPWLSCCRMKVVGWGMVLAVGGWLGRAGGEGAPPDAA